MARQSGVVMYRGKLGQTVGMKNGFGGSQAFTREYVATNSSESDAQIERRIRMLPAVNFRRQLAELIERGFQGVKYGGPSTREFMKYALILPLSDTPQLVKNSTVAFPGPYLISKGSLGNINVTIAQNAGTSNIRMTSTAYDDWGVFSQALIDGGMVKQGDLLTIICASIQTAEQSDPQNILYEVLSKQVDADSTDAMPDQPAGPDADYPFAFEINETSSALSFSAHTDNTIVGMAVVLSREGTTPLRSTSRMGVNTFLWPAFFGTTIKPDVKQSYTKTAAASRSTNWPYDPDINPEDSGFVTIGVTISPTGGGTVTGAGTYAKGDAVTLQATAASGYGFVRWSLNDVEVATNRTLQITASANANYVAEFLLDG